MTQRKKRPTASPGTGPGTAPVAGGRRTVRNPAPGATPGPAPSAAGKKPAGPRPAGKGDLEPKPPTVPTAPARPKAPARGKAPAAPEAVPRPAKPGPAATTPPASARVRTPRGGLPKGGPTKAECRKYREALLARRRALLASSKELAAEALQSGGGEFSVDHMADHGSDNYEQDFNLKLLQGEAEQLAEIRDALLKLDGKGELPYGLCEACADQSAGKCPTCPWIPATRLEAIPHARLCVPMKEREEARG